MKLNEDITNSLGKVKIVDPLKTQPIMITGLKVDSPSLNNPFAELEEGLGNDNSQSNNMFGYFQ